MSGALPRNRPRPRRPGPAHGLALLELLLAAALALGLAAAALQFVLAQIDEQQRLQADRRLRQDLLAVADLLARDLRRSGYWGHAGLAADRAARGEPVPANPYDGLSLAADGSAIGHAYSRDDSEDDQVAGTERFGLRLDAATGVLSWRVSGSALAPSARDAWQPLSDPTRLRVLRLALQVDEREQSLAALCALERCDAAAGGDCPPRRLSRQVRLLLEAADPRDATRTRRIELSSRVRNDEVRGVCPG